MNIPIKDGILSVPESKANCPHCTRAIPFAEIDRKWRKQSAVYIRIRCKCNWIIGITQDILGDFVAYEL